MTLGLGILIATLLAGTYMAWSIGANDVANAMGTSVGSGALTLTAAIIVAGTLEFSGAVLVGSSVTETIQKGIIEVSAFEPTGEFGADGPKVLAVGMLAALLAAAIWLHLATHYGLPVSTTHSIVGAIVGVVAPAVAPVAALGLADDLWSGPERGFRAHLRAVATTGTLKLVGIPLWGLWRTRSLSGAVLVALCANLVNQLDTRPGRALKATLAGALVLGGRPRKAVVLGVLLAPYDLREMTMLGDAGSNALGAMVGLESVGRLTGLRRASAIGALAAVTLLGERRSLGALVESTPGLRELDALGRYP